MFPFSPHSPRKFTTLDFLWLEDLIHFYLENSAKKWIKNVWNGQNGQNFSIFLFFWSAQMFLVSRITCNIWTLVIYLTNCLWNNLCVLWTNINKIWENWIVGNSFLYTLRGKKLGKEKNIFLGAFVRSESTSTSFT